MTLCIAWIEQESERIVALSDRRSSVAGMYNDRVAKIHTFLDANMFIMWEGETVYAKQILEAVTNLMVSQPSLGCRISTAKEIFERVLTRINDHWKRIHFNHYVPRPPPHGLSFIVGLFDYEEGRPLLQRVIRESDGGSWLPNDESTHTPSVHVPLFIVGSAVGVVNRYSVGRGILQPSTLADALRDALISDGSVGGVPQVVTLDRRGIVEYGIRKNGVPYVGGYEVERSIPLDRTIVFLDYGNLIPPQR